MKGIEKLLEAAKQHGLQSAPDHEVGDLQDIARAMWTHLSDRGKQYVLEEFHNLIEEWIP